MAKPATYPENQDFKAKKIPETMRNPGFISYKEQRSTLFAPV